MLGTMRSQAAVALLLVGLAAGAAAQEGGTPAVEIHGFVSQGFILTTDNNYLADSEDGSFELNEVGVNLTAPVTESLRLGVQFFARDLGPIGDYTAKLDWFYLDYRWRDWLGLRAGRVKVPFGLYNDVADVDPANNSVLLPQSVYPSQNRDFLLAQTGVELYGFHRLGEHAGALDYRLYGGTIFLELPSSNPTITVSSVKVPYLVGGRLFWETPLDGLRVGGSLQALRLDTTFQLQGRAEPVTLKLPAVLWVASLEYIRPALRIAAEYSRWNVDVESSDQMIYPDRTEVSERAYAMASYRVTPWLQPGVYYSLLFPDVDDREGREHVQHDVAGTLRFDINGYWLVKLEAHYMNGTAGLTTTLNGGRQLDTLEDSWAVFLAKTTAYF